MLSAGGEGAPKRTELRGDDIAALVGLVLKDGELVVSIELEVAVMRGRQLGDDDLEPCTIGGHPGACEQLLPVQPINTREQVRSALDEGDERAHGDRNLALGEIATNAVERREQPELLVNEPGEPLASNFRTLVRSRQRAERGALTARSAAARVAPHDAAALVLLDDVELLFDELVGNVQGMPASGCTGLGP